MNTLPEGSTANDTATPGLASVEGEFSMYPYTLIPHTTTDLPLVALILMVLPLSPVAGLHCTVYH